MVSTLLVLTAAASALALAWSLLRSVPSEIKNQLDWEERKHEIDVQIFRALLDSGEETYLRSSLSRNQFQEFRRKRIRLALRMLRLVEENAGMLMRLGQLARMKGDPALTEKADELVATAMQFRLNLLLAKLSLCLKWLFPSWTVSLPAFEARYQHLLDSVARVQQRGWQALT
jgi:hypothetical protein